MADLALTDVNLNALNVANLVISGEPVINAFAKPGSIQINLSVSQLISDSPSELAFLVGHELGHIAQFEHGGQFVLTDLEQDADLFGATSMIHAGFDPYAGAGALAKLSMVSGPAGLLATGFDNLADPHGSLTTRVDSMFNTMTLACAQFVISEYCAAYKLLIHPNFPATAPLSVTARLERVPLRGTH